LNAVTAVALYQPRHGPLLVLAGEGCFVKVFDALSSKLLAQCKIFGAQTIHGIAVLDPGGQDNSIEATFWGGKSFVLLGIEELEAIVGGDLNSTAASENIAPDWILDGAISPFPGFSSCVFVTAHSAILRLIQDKSSRRITLKILPSLSQSILYSAHIIWTSSGSIMVAGGTVFGEVEVSVWQQIIVDALIRSCHIYTFTGHEGSVFGVRISPEFIGRDGSPTRYLASCSDDRTIRIWNLSVYVVGQCFPKIEQESNAGIRDTGFREHDNTSLNDTSASRCIAVRMAHASRIWRVDFIAWQRSLLKPRAKIHVLSFGEDSTCQQWVMDFVKSSGELEGKTCQDTRGLSTGSTSSYPAVLTHLKTFSYHSGKHIWSATLSFHSQTSKRLVTGGADGKVAIYDIFLDAPSERSSPDAINRSEAGEWTSKQQSLQSTTRSWTLKDILHSITPTNRSSEEASIRVEKHLENLHTLETLDIGTSSEGKKLRTAQITEDAPNRYGFVGENEILVTTSLGRILFVSLTASYKWEELDFPCEVRNGLRSYSLLLGVPAFGIGLLAGANGMIYLYHKKVVTELMKVNGKPAALLNVSIPSEERLDILVTTLGSDIAYQLSITASALQSPSLEQVMPIKLPLGFIVTSAGNVMRFIILGGRNGSIALYDLENSKEPIRIVSGQEAQRDDAITTIISIPSPNTQDDRCHFLTTSRDGSYSIFCLMAARDTDNVSGNISIDLVHRAFPPLGPMIEAAWFSESDLMLYGFRGTSFIVWNETKQCEILNVECGGGHRSYAYMPITEIGGAGHFAYTKASMLYINSQTHPSHRTLKPGGHGREIKVAATHVDFIATGAEDTAIRIWRIRKEGGEPRRAFITVDGESGKNGNTVLECCAVLEKHTTGIQHLHWCCSSDDYHSLFSAGGAEEFHVWAVSDIPGFGVGVVCEATLADLSEDRDLRIMGFDVEFIYDRRPRSKAERGSNGKNEITLIYSDSTIKCFDYSRTTGFKKTAQGKYTSSCLTQVVCLRESSGVQKFFTTSTDGHLALWKSPQRANIGRFTFNTTPLPDDAPIPELELTLRLKVHQSSISALIIQHLSLLHERGGLLVATAGDDNAIWIIFFNNLVPVKRIIIPSAHAACITGLGFKSNATGGEWEHKWIQLWSVGGDQRVKRWTIEFGLADENPKATMENGLNMRVLGLDEVDDVWCSVADPGGLVVWRDNWEEDHALVYGNGMEAFKLRDGFPNGIGERWVGIVKEEPIPV
jgi:WD40 repeat protein